MFFVFTIYEIKNEEDEEEEEKFFALILGDRGFIVFFLNLNF